MHNLLAFFTKYYHWFLFLLLEVISGVMLFSYNSYQGSVWISSANAVVGKAYEWESDMEHFFSLVERNEALTRRNLVLEQQVQYYREALADAHEDSVQSLQRMMASLGNYTFIPAKVVSNSIDLPNNLITIDRGAKDGVEVDMGVACGTGIVGVVYLTGDHYSVVIPLLNTQSRISCAIRGKNYYGYVTWPGGNSVIANVDDMPRHAKFKKGDWVETSGYSAIFPQGVLVGKIETIYNSPDGLSYRLKVRLATDFACLRDVCVISDKSIAERSRLLEQVQDSLTMKPE